MTAWEAIEKAEAPRPARDKLDRPRPRPRPASVPEPSNLPDGTRVTKLTSAGVFMLDKALYMVGRRHGFRPVLVITDVGKRPPSRPAAQQPRTVTEVLRTNCYRSLDPELSPMS